MAERSARETFVHDLQNKLYDAAGFIADIVDEVSAVVEDAAKNFERETTPTYSINVDVAGANAEDVRDWVNAHRESNGLPLYDNVDDAGGREEGQPLSREQLLREVYRYNAAHHGLYLDWTQRIEDMYVDPDGREYLVGGLIEDLMSAIRTDKS